MLEQEGNEKQGRFHQGFGCQHRHRRVVGQQKDAAVDQNRGDHGLRAEPNFVINGLVQQIHQRQFRRLAHGNAKNKAAQQGDERHIKVFPEEHPADVPLVHAQHIVKAEFLVALPDQEGIGIEQKQQ